MHVDRRRALALVGGAALCPATASAQGFAGLGVTGEGYAPVVPGHALRFPRDHGAHPDFRIEWWYVTANLDDDTGAEYGIQWTLFRQATAPPPQREGWSSQQFWLAHAALTTRDAHFHAERTARGGVGQAGVTAAPFAAWIDDWSFTSTDGAFSPLRLRAEGEDFAYTLALSTEAAMVRQGDGGYSRKSDRGQASYYVSQPFFSAEGTLRIDGRDVVVSGRAWMDREWSSQPLAPDQEGWDWFSLHLETGEKVMLFRLRSSDGSAYRSGNWITPEGDSTPIPPEAIRVEPLAETRVAGRDVPTSWRLSIDGRRVDGTVRPLNPRAWNGGGLPYWEGPITLDGPTGGRGYLEMTGY